ncbi:MAG TPA: LysM peptidoglycan-binding domain-containing protein [Candidatus Acidoferrum sp.]|nr:LysM peptidoglycan-binding domain-containing protein [Candidatus Acidoferrum sp.]
MSVWNNLVSSILAVGLGLALSGCSPSGQSPVSEEKEPHFVLGKSRVNAMDFEGAVEAFAQSLEANPNSAAAHYELGMLYDAKIPDPAAAIYHYQQYLKLNSKADNADLINQRIIKCKQQLAGEVQPRPDTPAAQQQLQQLYEQNRQLQDEVNKWRAYYASQSAAAKTNAAPTPAYGNPPPTGQPVLVQSGPKVSASSTPELAARAASSKAGAAGRTHTVAAGETAMGITRKYGVKFNALQAANPGVNLGRLRAGQVLNLPAP